MKTPADKITIIGLGLIGGSLAKAFHKHYNPAPFIHAVDTDINVLKRAENEGVINSYSDKPDCALTGSRAVFLCVPVKDITRFFAQISLFAPDAVITDTGGIKRIICARADKNNIRFIGGHPMAGSQKSGYAAAKDFLFENAYYPLSPSACASKEDIALLSGLLSGIGAYPMILSPEEHDTAAAYISHIPHIIASLLVNTIASKDDENGLLRMLAAGGFRDITRIASSDPNMWDAICALNKDAIQQGLEEFTVLLDKFRSAAAAGGSLAAFFENAKRYRDGLDVKPAAAYKNEYQIFVDIQDRPGMIAEVSRLLAENNVNIRNIGIVNSREYINGVLQVVLETAENMRKSAELLENMGFTVYEE